MEYIQALSELQKTLNKGKGKGNTAQEFKDAYFNFPKMLSTKFLKSLIVGTEKEKENRINYLKKKCGLKVKRELRYFTEREFNKYAVEIYDYTHSKKKKVYSEDVNLLTPEEEQRIKEIAEISINTGFKFELDFCLNDFSYRKNLRESINKSDGVYLKDVKVQQIGKDSLRHKQEVLYFFVL